MTLLQFALNVVFGLLAFALTRYTLGAVGLDGVVALVISILLGLGVFFANFAARIRV